MLTFYVLDDCAYCHKVLSAAELLGLEYRLKRLNEPGVAEELVARGGKRQVPYLADNATGTELYESDDIVAYLHHRFAPAAIGSSEVTS